MITASNTPMYGISTLANSFVRNYHASLGWSHALGSSLLNEGAPASHAMTNTRLLLGSSIPSSRAWC
jgi:hypothetical protein